MNVSRLTKSARRFAASAAILAALGLSTACGSEPQQAPAPTPAPTASAEQAADTSAALRDSFNAAKESATWADKVTSIKLDGRAVVVATTLTKADKKTTVAICEAAYKAAKDTKTDFLGIAVRSADNSTTLANRNDKFGPAKCEN